VVLVLSAVVGTAAIKIREKKREIERRTENLRNAEQSFRTITDALPSMIAYWDRHLINQFANRAHQDVARHRSRRHEGQALA